MDGEIYKYSPYRYVDLQDVSEKYPDDGIKQWRETIKRLFEYPHPLVGKQSEQPKKVCIIGGGIAGLTAAYELASRNNVTVTLLEATNRFGGRIWTYRFPDGTYGELGAMRVPVIHGCVCYYIKKFKLKYRRFVDRNIEAFFHLRGGPRVKQEAWHNLLSKYPLMHTWENIKANASNPIAHFAGLMAVYGSEVTIISKLEPMLRDFVIPKGGALDLFEQLSLGQMLRRPPHLFRHTSALSSDAYEYLGRANGTLWLERASFLQFWLNELPLKEPNKIELVGGMETLVDAFVREVNNTGRAVMSKNARVKGVTLIPNEDKVKVMWESKYADHLSEKFDYVICTVPAQPTTRIEFDPPLSSSPSGRRKYEALTKLSHCSAAKTIVHCNERHWELVDGIYGGGSFTDLSIQQCWYPSDNSRKAKRHVGSAAAVGSADEIHANKRAQGRWKAADPNKSKQPGVFTGSYTWEANARRFAAMSEDQRNKVVFSDLRTLHPGIEHVIDDMVHCVWDTETNPGHGAFAFFAPGEQRQYQAALCQPWPSHKEGDAAKIFFAGEHVAIMHGWIQSAIQSALTAVMNVLEAPS